MQEVEVQVGGKSFKRAEEAFRHLADNTETLFSGAAVPISRAMKETLQLVARKVTERHNQPWSARAQGGPNLQRRSGGSLKAMEKSIRMTNNGSLSSVRGTISTGFWSIHETGGVVRAKRAGYLTIPLPRALDQRGVPLKQRARDWTNTFVARSRRGNLLIFQKRGRKDIVPLYVLKREVKIPARLGMHKTIVGDALPYFERRAFEALDAHFDKVFS